MTPVNTNVLTMQPAYAVDAEFFARFTRTSINAFGDIIAAARSLTEDMEWGKVRAMALDFGSTEGEPLYKVVIGDSRDETLAAILCEAARVESSRVAMESQKHRVSRQQRVSSPAGKAGGIVLDLEWFDGEGQVILTAAGVPYDYFHEIVLLLVVKRHFADHARVDEYCHAVAEEIGRLSLYQSLLYAIEHLDDEV